MFQGMHYVYEVYKEIKKCSCEENDVYDNMEC